MSRRSASGLAITRGRPSQLYGKGWVIFAKAPFKKPDALFRYLGLYINRVAISNHCILRIDDDQVAFRTRDDNICKLPPIEFIRRFLLHVLPRGFVKVRHFGLYAAGNVNSKLAAARTAIERQTADGDNASPAPAGPVVAPDWRTLFHQLTGIDLAACPHCGHRLSAEPLPRPAWSPRDPPP
jgi:hypothetical protein